MRNLLLILLAFTLLCTPAFGAIANVNCEIGNFYSATAGSSIATAPVSHTAGNFVVVAVRWAILGSAVTLSSITDTAGNTYTLATTYFSGSAADAVTIGYAANILGNASNVLTANFSNAGASYRGILACQFSGVATASPLDVLISGATGTNNAPTSSSFTTTNANDLIFIALDQGALGGNYTAGSGYTLSGKSVDVALDIQWKTVSSIQTGVTAASSSTSSSMWLVYGATFKAAGAVVTQVKRHRGTTY